jgi:hypothetical protein
MEQIMCISDSPKVFFSIAGQRLWQVFLPMMPIQTPNLITPSSRRLSLTTQQNWPTDHPQFPDFPVRAHSVFGQASKDIIKHDDAPT